MPATSSDNCKFLLRPQIHEFESFRGYVVRVAIRNDSLNLVRPLLKTLTDASNFLPTLAQLTDIDLDVLSSHGALVGDGNTSPLQARIGDARLSPNQLRHGIRYVCPLCMAERGISLGYWELRRYSTCHIHGVRLINACSNCKMSLNWDTGTLAACTHCGLELSQMQSCSVPNSGELGVSTCLAKAYMHSLDSRSSTTLENPGNVFFPIDWALLLMEFLEYVLIPEFIRHIGAEEHRELPQDFSDLISTMLLDERYRRILRGAVFLHAAKDPMNLRQLLLPGNSVVDVVRSFHECTDDIPFHECLWALQRELLKKPARLRDLPQRQSHPHLAPKAKRRGGIRNFDYFSPRYEPMPTQEFGVA